MKLDKTSLQNKAKRTARIEVKGSLIFIRKVMVVEVSGLLTIMGIRPGRLIYNFVRLSEIVLRKSWGRYS